MRGYTLIVFVMFSLILQAQRDDPLEEIRILLFNGKFEELLTATQNPEMPDSMRAELLHYRGYAFNELSRPDSALHYFRQALEGDPTNLSYKKTLGKVCHSQGRTREAIMLFEEVLKVDPLDHESRLELAALYMLRKEYLKSLEFYMLLIESDSLNYFLFKQAGICYMETGQHESALYFFERAFDLNPADIYLTRQIVNFYISDDKLDKAIHAIHTGMGNDTTHAELLSLRGYLWFLKENPSRAIRDLEASVLWDSNSVFTYKYLGLAFLQQNRWDEARMALLRAYKMDSLDITIIFSLGSACRWSDFKEEATSYYLRAILLLQSSLKVMKNAHTELAEIYTELDQFENALAYYEGSLSYDTRDNFINYKMAQVYDYYLNRKVIAIKYYEKYLAGESAAGGGENEKEPDSDRLQEIVQSRIDHLKEALEKEE